MRPTLRAGLRRHIRNFAESAASTALKSPRVRGYAFDALHLLTESASATINGVHYSFSTNDWIIGRSLYISGRWDDEFMEATVKLLADRPGIRPLSGGVFVDVGANIGTTTIQALNRFGAERVVAIEPSPRCLPYLYSNLAANKLSDRCTVMEVAMSDVPGEVAFRAGENNSGAGEVLQAGGTPDYIVPARKLDDVISFLGISADDLSLVWVDTEGHEYRVLSGASRVLDAGIPMVIEFWPERLHENGDFDSLVEILARRIGTIIDVRAQVRGTQDPLVESTVSAINAYAKTLGPLATDLLLLPRPAP